MARFLRFIVDRTLSGATPLIKEYAIGVEVFEKPAAFDPRVDSLVRVEARRLRNKLRDYYETTGCRDPIVIDLVEGSYVPHFSARGRLGSPQLLILDGPQSAATAEPAAATGEGPLRESAPLIELAGYHAGKLTLHGLLRSRHYIERALQRQPADPCSCAQAALTYAGLSVFGGVAPARALTRARDLARLAIEGDPALPAAHISAAFVAGLRNMDWRMAESALDRACELSTGSALAAFGRALAHLLVSCETVDTDFRQLEKLSGNAAATFHSAAGCAVLTFLSGDLDHPAAYVERLIELEPELYWPRLLKALFRSRATVE
jgi:hypothetical protein